jgi:hypothetical protein
MIARGEVAWPLEAVFGSRPALRSCPYIEPVEIMHDNEPHLRAIPK